MLGEVPYLSLFDVYHFTLTLRHNYVFVHRMVEGVWVLHLRPEFFCCCCFLVFVYLTVLCLGYSTQDLSLWRTDSLVEVHVLSCLDLS